MSSFAKAHKAQRRTHRERPQPLSRASRFDLLEKGSDWKIRREDHKRKQKHKKTLLEKARDRNPDEFYFGMINAKTKDGVQYQRRPESQEYTAEQLKSLKKQDYNYIVTKRAQERRKIERLQSNLHFVGVSGEDGAALNQHIVFCDSDKEAKSLDLADHFDTPAELLDRRHNRPKKDALRRMELDSDLAPKQLKNLRRQQEDAYDELRQRIEREAKIHHISEKLEQERNLMGKGRRVKVKDGDGKDKLPVYRWKKERKR